MSTFNPRIGKSIPVGPNDNSPDTFNRLINSFSPADPVPFFSVIKARPPKSITRNLL